MTDELKAAIELVKREATKRAMEKAKAFSRKNDFHQSYRAIISRSELEDAIDSLFGSEESPAKARK